MRQTYTYSDIGLVPTEPSEIKSRDHVDPSTLFMNRRLSLPVVVAPMDTVVGKEMCDELRRLGGVACTPRNRGSVYHIPSYSLIQLENGLYSSGRYSHPHLCIDVANGFSEQIKYMVELVKRKYANVKIIAGNVASVEGYEYMADIGVDAVRCGIGGGHMCSTSIQTGVGVGQASLIRDLAKYRQKYIDGPLLCDCESYKFHHQFYITDTCSYDPFAKPKKCECDRCKEKSQRKWPLIIADGGIKNAGDVAKAIALGADVVMIGTLFGGCEETPGSVIKYNNKLYKQMAGQASFAVKRSDKYVEGDDTLVPYSGKLEKLWNKIEDGLRSSMSYMNCKTIEEFRYLPDKNFCLLSPSAKVERGIHV